MPLHTHTKRWSKLAFAPPANLRGICPWGWTACQICSGASLAFIAKSLKVNGHHGFVQRVPFGCLKRPRSTFAQRCTIMTLRADARDALFSQGHEQSTLLYTLHYSEISSKWARKQRQDFLWHGTWAILHRWHRTADLIPDAERLQVSLAWLHGDPVPGNASALRITRSSWFIDDHRWADGHWCSSCLQVSVCILEIQTQPESIQRGIAGLEPSQGQRCWQSGKTIVQVTQTYRNGKMQFKLFECTWCGLVELHCGVAFSSAQDGTNI